MYVDDRGITEAWALRASRLAAPLVVAAGIAAPWVVSDARAQGMILPGVGPENTSMAGTAVAAPIDAAGALHWNPGSIAGLGRSSFTFGMEALLIDSAVSSSVDAGALGRNFPPVRLSGSDDGDNGIFAMPAVAVVVAPDESPWVFGLGFFGIGGFGVNYRASTTNPILTPQPPAGLGLGAVFSRLQIAQFNGTVAYRVNDRLSIGFAPTVNAAELRLSPGSIAAPDDANGDGFSSFPSAQQSKIEWGVGFQLGLYWQHESGWRLGASFKSPQWFESFKFKITDELGRPREDASFDFTYPMMLSAGISYAGVDQWLFALDVRFIDFENAEGLNDAGFEESGAITGLGWQNSWVVSLATQFTATERLTVRGGFFHTESPITDPVTAFNLGSPGMQNPMLSLGLSYHLTRELRLSVTYGRLFRQSIEGPFLTPLGSIPGTLIETNASIDRMLFGVTAGF